MKETIMQAFWTSCSFVSFINLFLYILFNKIFAFQVYIIIYYIIIENYINKKGRKKGTAQIRQ